MEKILPSSRSISDAWLNEKRIEERGFSLGFFHENYLKRLPCGIVRRNGDVIAFANLWPGGGKEELSVDLMRYGPEAALGVMTYLFVQIMLWGRQEGYRWFNLGMAPLSGLENRALSPLWNRIGHLAFRHGDQSYHFEGLRDFKDKFDPLWTPKYLASPGGLALPVVLADLVSLVSRRRSWIMAG